jgi:hypothetical protein
MAASLEGRAGKLQFNGSTGDDLKGRRKERVKSVRIVVLPSKRGSAQN